MATQNQAFNAERELLHDGFARNLLPWKHSGFGIDNSVRILDEFAQESRCYAGARPHPAGGDAKDI